jgi:hypothetical protein
MRPEPSKVEIPKHMLRGGTARLKKAKKVRIQTFPGPKRNSNLLLPERLESVEDGDGEDEARPDDGRQSDAHKNCGQRKSTEQKESKALTKRWRLVCG